MREKIEIYEHLMMMGFNGMVDENGLVGYEREVARGLRV